MITIGGESARALRVVSGTGAQFATPLDEADDVAAICAVRMRVGLRQPSDGPVGQGFTEVPTRYTDRGSRRGAPFWLVVAVGLGLAVWRSMHGSPWPLAAAFLGTLIVVGPMRAVMQVRTMKRLFVSRPPVPLLDEVPGAEPPPG